MTRSCFYAGDPGHQVFGWHHVPTTEPTRGAVVICTSIGLEAEYAHTAIRVLAEKLEGVGYAALRFDYLGTGDSEDPPPESDEVDSWIEAIGTTVTYARLHHRGPHTLVGLRIGAGLAAAAAKTSEVEQIVLWDPCSGSAFLRRQRALRMTVYGAPPEGDGSVDLPGVTMRSSTSEAVSRLNSPMSDVTAGRVLVLTRPGGPTQAHRGGASDGTTDGVSDGTTVEYKTLVGQAELLDVNPVLSRVCDDDLDAIVAWLAPGTPPGTVSVPTTGPVLRSTPEPTSTLAPAMSTWCGDVALIERPTVFGRRRLFGIVAEPSSEPHPGGARPGIVFLNSGRFRHTGPGRSWVSLGRLWASYGYRTLRIDLSGLGDSGAGGETDLEGYPPTALEDMLDAAALVSPGDPTNTVFVGVCSGGFHALLAGLALRCRGVCAINPGRLPGAARTGNQSWWTRSKAASSVTAGGKTVLESLKARTQNLSVSLADSARPISLRLPSSMWWFINRLTQRLVPAKVSERLIHNGTNVLVVTETGLAQFMRRGEGLRVRRMERSGNFALIAVEGLDHDLFSGPARRQVVDALTSHLVATFGREVTTAGGGARNLRSRQTAAADPAP